MTSPLFPKSSFIWVFWFAAQHPLSGDYLTQYLCVTDKETQTQNKSVTTPTVIRWQSYSSNAGLLILGLTYFSPSLREHSYCNQKQVKAPEKKPGRLLREATADTREGEGSYQWVQTNKPRAQSTVSTPLPSSWPPNPPESQWKASIDHVTVREAQK